MVRLAPVHQETLISCSCFLLIRDGTLMATFTDSFSSGEYVALSFIQPYFIPCFLHWANGEREECLSQGLMKLDAVLLFC